MRDASAALWSLVAPRGGEAGQAAGAGAGAGVGGSAHEPPPLDCHALAPAGGGGGGDSDGGGDAPFGVRLMDVVAGAASGGARPAELIADEQMADAMEFHSPSDGDVDIPGFGHSNAKSM